MNETKVVKNPSGVVNLTPHTVKIVSDGVEYVIEPSGMVARVSAVYNEAAPARQLPNVTFVTREFGEVEGLPEPDGNMYIVSGFVLAAVEASGDVRMDVVAPDTGPTAIRDDKNRILAVTRLIYPNFG